MREIILCADEESLQDPSIIGLDGESLDQQQWLLTVSDAQAARDSVSNGRGANEAWVASSNEMDPINLAAALKRDCREMRVCLVSWRGSGSLRSRASAAGIDEVIGYADLARRYAAAKEVFRRDNPRRRTPASAEAEKAGGRGRADEVRDNAGNASRGASEHVDAPVGDVTAPIGRSRPPVFPMREPENRESGYGPEARNAGSAGTIGIGRMPGAQARRRGYALCVVSASGGTGKSTVAALSSLIAASHGYRTVLIDADLQFGDIASMFGQDDVTPIDAAVADPLMMEGAVPQAGHPVVLSASERIEHSELYLPQIPGLIERAREAFDVVVVNTGAFWTESHVQIIEACSNALFLMDQRPTSVSAVRRALDLCARCGVASHPFLFAVNRCSRKALLTSIDISCALNGVAVAELKDGGSAVAELMSSGLATKLVEDRNDLCLSLNDFLGGVIPDALGGVVPEPVPAEGSKGRSKGKAKRHSGARKGKVACL